MPKIKYIAKKFSSITQDVIDKANEIVDEYDAQGFQLSLRQVYYQFVSRGLINNDEREYKRLGNIMNDGRLAGEIDWYAIEDRSRNLRGLSHWETPKELLNSALASFRMDKWDKQHFRPEVWIEKDALVGVIEGVCDKLDMNYFSCRGYVSQSEMWKAARRLDNYFKNGQVPVIFYLGDHDPSGIDMTRDIEDRLQMFMNNRAVRVERLALNFPQIKQFNPPPNPAKSTDSRFSGYIKKYGDKSWELDALDPKELVKLIENEANLLINSTKRDKIVKQEKAYKKRIEIIVKTF